MSNPRVRRNNSTAKILKLLLKNQEKLIMKVSEISGLLLGILATLTKVKTEFNDRVASLEAKILANAGDADVPADVVADLEALKASVQELDNLNPDIVSATQAVQSAEQADTAGTNTGENPTDSAASA